MSKAKDLEYMKQALQEAGYAQQQGDVPVGALLVRGGQVLAKGHNQREAQQKATGHAEIVVIEQACKKLGQWRLHDCELYVTLEPCLMCAGALLQARVSRLVYACADPKAGAVHSLYQVLQDTRLNHQVLVSSGILETECSQLLSTFFRRKR